jgi:hypothetical protein
MKKRYLAAGIAIGLIGGTVLAILTTARGVAPSGQVDIGVSGYNITFTLHDMRGVNQNDEVTVGTHCFRADGSQIPVGQGGNPYIYEVHWFGHYDRLGSFTAPPEAVACRSQLIAAKWFKGTVTAAWVLDPWQDFLVPNV